MTATSQSDQQELGPFAQFDKFLGEGQFMLQNCGQCHKFIFYPRALCPYCSSTDLSWQKASGKGRVYSTTTVRRRPEKGGPYNVCLVDLDEGVRMMGTLKGVEPEDVTIDMPVAARIEAVGDQKAVVFVEAGGQ